MQDLLEAYLGPQLLSDGDLLKPLSDLVQRGKRVLAMVEVPNRLTHKCGVRLTGKNLDSSWRDETRTVGDMMKDLESWYRSGRMRPEPGRLKILEVCLPGAPFHLGPEACKAFRGFLQEGHTVRVATKFDFPDPVTIRALVEQNWSDPDGTRAQAQQTPRSARDVNQVFEKLERQPGSGSCLDKLQHTTELLGRCTSAPFLCIVYGGSAGGSNWGYAVTSCETGKKSWISGACYCYLELATLHVSKALSDREFREGCEKSICQSIEKFPDGSHDCCIERASFIANAMSEKAGVGCYAICKRSPGGYDQWAYQGPAVTASARFHEWRETSPGLFGLGAVSHCFVVQLY